MAVIRTPASDNASIICELCGLPQIEILVTRQARNPLPIPERMSQNVTPKKRPTLKHIETVKKEKLEQVGT